MDQKLLHYIKEQLSKGYTIEQIREFLIKYGYAINVIDETIRYMQELHRDVSNAYSEEIRSKVKGALDKGYSKEMITRTLLQEGHDFRVIRSIIGQFTKSTEEALHDKQFHWKPVAITVAVCLVVFLAVFFSFNTVEEFTLLDVGVGLISKEVVSGGTLLFKVDVSNLGTEQRYDILIEYEVINVDNGRLLLSESQTKAIATTLSYIEQLDVPHFAEDGNYELKVSVKYDGKTANASVVFAVKAFIEEVKYELECVKDSDCGSGVCKGYECVEVVEEKEPDAEPQEIAEIEPVEDVLVTLQEQVDGFVKLAEEDSTEAAKLCSESDGLLKDVCYLKVASIAGDVSLCDFILDLDRKDKCYYKFGLKDSAVCEKISEEFKKQTCLQISSYLS